MPLNTPLFIDPQDVILRMQVNGSLDGVVETITSAIQGAQLKVQALLDSQLMIQQQSCTYLLDSDAFSGVQPGSLFRLEIPSGFVRTDTPVVVSNADTWLSPNYETSDNTLYRIDYNRGFLLMDATTFADQYVSLTCATGFNPSVPTPPFTTTPTSYDLAVVYNPGDSVSTLGMVYVCIAQNVGNVPPNALYWASVSYGPEQIPPEVYEAIMSYVPVVFDASQTTNRSQEAVPQYQKAADHAMLILKPFMRMRGFAFRPIDR